ncbi:MoaD family protein [Candidatus Methanomassiliicoccus intestinalis]|uniref:MoaD family protein n=1 Tax=Candidatus Methanomassiliicoccus intestinalis TaxID=1406512 RepID=UPI0037DCD7F4
MTHVVFRTFGNLCSATKKNQLELDFNGSTVQDFLTALVQEFGEDLQRLLYPGGTLSEFIFILINGKNIDGLAGLETPIKDGDVVSVLPVTAGG